MHIGKTEIVSTPDSFHRHFQGITNHLAIFLSLSFFTSYHFNGINVPFQHLCQKIVYDLDKVVCTHRETIDAMQIQEREEKIAHQMVKFQDKTCFTSSLVGL